MKIEVTSYHMRGKEKEAVRTRKRTLKKIVKLLAANSEVDNYYIETIGRSIRCGMFDLARVYLRDFKNVLENSESESIRTTFMRFSSLVAMAGELEKKYGYGCFLDTNNGHVIRLLNTENSGYIPHSHIINSAKTDVLPSKNFFQWQNLL